MVQIHFEGKTIDLKPGETLLQALVRARANPSYSCVAGLCHSCLLQAQSGTIPRAAQVGLSPDQCQQDLLLACQCRPESPLTVRRPHSARRTDAMVSGIRALSPAIMELRLSPRSPISYQAGQHIDLWHGPYLTRHYSLASVPALDSDLLFHIQAVPGGQFSHWVHTQAEVGSLLQLGSAQGDCRYGSPQPGAPLLLIGSGSGLGPLYGLLRDALNQLHRGPIELLHLARDEHHLYLQDELIQLARQHPNLRYSSLVGPVEALAPLLDAAIDRCDQRRAQAYLCGASRLVTEATRRLRDAGLNESQIHSDTFDAQQLDSLPDPI
ncbi:2Fe-2S iron-sulfur cluster-binding protein [Aestuariirhabdus litorea]|uniref:Uncharacterized protein n=1 Tax=Aestuariirhabdus litorea TaxID=2528527 RepID=A0A3P3VQS6_9GAMM|nr:2Fe-2S iron-sulfur cluster binding domain-containing protein [Aestuariirhabdus litorea]RRJ83879.1 hypothetical protein D0544_01810 [Aestuariirhabdus litorea]RWW97101.1 2Fe-2S iron-sulfur cluster binding domain-containing protein [Endozoicomonadaceae bacterium GTF-13]